MIFDGDVVKDLFGALVSGLCIVQCLVGAGLIIAGSTGLIATSHHSSDIHFFFIVPVVLFALWSFPSGKKCHGNSRPMKFAGVGLVILLCALAFEALWHLHEIETILTVIGGGILVYAHLQNRKLTQQVSVSS